MYESLRNWLKGSLWVKASKETPYGKILVHWEKKESSLLLNVTIPANSEATITLPSQTRQVRLNGKTLTNATSIHIPSAITKSFPHYLRIPKLNNHKF